MRFLAVLITLACADGPAAPPDTAEAKIRQVLQQWPKDFNNRNKAGVYSLFAPDVVASYPGQPDRGFEAMCKHLESAIDHPRKRFRYDAADIHQIIVSGDLAVVRLTWTLRITEPEKAGATVVRERGMDVFRRQKDGSWKVSISYAHPDPVDEQKGR